jgi:uncharacterized OB-fold protein
MQIGWTQEFTAGESQGDSHMAVHRHRRPLQPRRGGLVHLAGAAADRQPLRGCGTVAFRPRVVRPLPATDTSEHLLSRQGTLWTWTVQGFRPKSPPYTGPVDFEPFPVGYVELPGEVKVETRLVDVTPSELRIGMPMELAIVPFEQESGGAVLTFAFRPIIEEPNNE